MYKYYFQYDRSEFEFKLQDDEDDDDHPHHRQSDGLLGKLARKWIGGFKKFTCGF